MITDKKLIHADLTYRIRGAIFTIYNILGYGHKEQVYQKALSKELDELKIPYQRESNLSVTYKGESIGIYRPDSVVDTKVIIELKAVEFMPKSFEDQLLHYLKATSVRITSKFWFPSLANKKTYMDISVNLLIICINLSILKRKLITKLID